MLGPGGLGAPAVPVAAAAAPSVNASGAPGVAAAAAAAGIVPRPPREESAFAAAEAAVPSPRVALPTSGVTVRRDFELTGGVMRPADEEEETPGCTATFLVRPPPLALSAEGVTTTGLAAAAPDAFLVLPDCLSRRRKASMRGLGNTTRAVALAAAAAGTRPHAALRADH